MNRYCLVARNKTTNMFKIIGINDGFYKSNVKFPQDNYVTSLEAIDLFTTLFNNSSDLKNYLVKNKYIDDGNYDIYIAYDGKNDILYNEPLYKNNSNYNLTEKIRLIAAASNQDYIKEVSNYCKSIIFSLIKNTYSSSKFYKMVTGNDTLFSSRIVDVLKNITKKNYKNIPFNLIGEMSWAIENYKMLRNVIEMFNTFENSNDIIYQYSDAISYRDNLSERAKLNDSIKMIFKKEVINGQLGIFDDDLEKYYSKGNVDINHVISFPNEIEQVQLPLLDKNNKKDKITQIIDFFRLVPRNSFLIKSNKIYFNDEIFKFELDENTKDKLDKLLPVPIKKDLINLLTHLNGYKNSMYERGAESSEIDYYERSIRNKLSNNDSKIDKVYEWCSLFSDCVVEGYSYNQDCKKFNLVDGDAILKKKL